MDPSFNLPQFRRSYETELAEIHTRNQVIVKHMKESHSLNERLITISALKIVFLSAIAAAVSFIFLYFGTEVLRMRSENSAELKFAC